MMDLNYGNPIMPKVDQGYADDSVWSRGQAWGMYGPMLTYIYIKDQRALDTFISAAPIRDTGTGTFLNTTI